MIRWRTLLGLAVLQFSAACTEKPTIPVEDSLPIGSYSSTVQPIFNRSCTNALGCHGPANPAARLELTSWDKLIAGSRYGETIIAFRPEESHLIEHLTGASTPRMPLSRDPLPPAQIEIIRSWVTSGARNDAGQPPFPDRRSKLYVTNQGSDKVSVIDAEAMVVSRLIDVDMTAAIDSPHNVHIDRQGRYGYVTLINSGILVQFDAAADSVVATAQAGQAPAHPITSPDGSTVYVTDWDPFRPSLIVFDAATLTEKGVIYFPPTQGGQPHGIAISRDGKFLYCANTSGQSIFKIEIGETIADTRLSLILLGNPGERLDPLQVMLDGDESHVFVTCNVSGDVRVVDVAHEQVVQVIPIGGRVASQGRSPDGSRIVVASWERNAVVVIDTRSMQVVGSVGNDELDTPVFAHPHAAAFTGDGRYVFVTNENTNGAYPQHHPSEGGGRNGNVAILDASTLAMVKVLEVEIFPTGVAFSGQ